MAQTKEKKKEGLPTKIESFEKKVKIEFPIEVHNENFLCFHSEVATGTYGKKSYSLLSEVLGRALYLQYGKKKYVLSATDFVKTLLDHIENKKI